MRPADIENIASGLRPGDRFELTDEFEHTFEVCESLEEALRHAPDYGCARINVLRASGHARDRRPVFVLDLDTARAVLETEPRKRSLLGRFGLNSGAPATSRAR